MQQVVQKKSHEAVQTIDVKEIKKIKIKSKNKKNFNFFVIYYALNFFFRFKLFLSCCFLFCLLSHFQIIRCIVKSLIATSMYFLLKYNWKKNLKNVLWVPKFVGLNQYTSLPNGLDTWLLNPTDFHRDNCSFPGNIFSRTWMSFFY